MIACTVRGLRIIDRPVVEHALLDGGTGREETVHVLCVRQGLVAATTVTVTVTKIAAATRARPHTLLRALHPVGLNRGTEDPLVHREGVAIDAKRAVRVAPRLVAALCFHLCISQRPSKTVPSQWRR